MEPASSDKSSSETRLSIISNEHLLMGAGGKRGDLPNPRNRWGIDDKLHRGRPDSTSTDANRRLHSRLRAATKWFVRLPSIPPDPTVAQTVYTDRNAVRVGSTQRSLEPE